MAPLTIGPRPWDHSRSVATHCTAGRDRGANTRPARLTSSPITGSKRSAGQYVSSRPVRLSHTSPTGGAQPRPVMPGPDSSVPVRRRSFKRPARRSWSQPASRCQSGSCHEGSRSNSQFGPTTSAPWRCTRARSSRSADTSTTWVPLCAATATRVSSPLPEAWTIWTPSMCSSATPFLASPSNTSTTPGASVPSATACQTPRKASQPPNESAIVRRRGRLDELPAGGAGGQSSNRAATRARGDDVRGLVELAGIEPATPCLQSRCSSQLSYSPEELTDYPPIARRPRPGSQRNHEDEKPLRSTTIDLARTSRAAAGPVRQHVDFARRPIWRQGGPS